MEKIRENLRNWLEENKTVGIGWLERFVKVCSVQGNEAEAQKEVMKVLHDLDLELDCWDPAGQELFNHSYFCSTRKSFTNSPNIIGIWKGTGEGRSIILNGHIDVVPAGDIEQWEHNPYEPTIKDGIMYGRGTSDMKGGNVSMLLAIHALKECGVRLKGDVIFQSVIEEESGGAGTLAAILRGYKADAALVPEPTHMRIFPKQQGSMWFRIYVKGKAAHGGTRYEGISAIEKSSIVIKHIQKLEEKRNARIVDPLYDKTPIPIPINIGKIEGGDWPSSVPDLVKIEGRMGVAPEEDLEEAKKELNKWLTRLPEYDSWFKAHPVKLDWIGATWVPGAIEMNHPFMKSLVSQYKQIRDEDPIIEASPWGTDAGLLSNVGEIPTIVFGPGKTETAHHPNEHIELDLIFQTALITACTMMDWCGYELLQEDDRQKSDT